MKSKKAGVLALSLAVSLAAVQFPSYTVLAAETDEVSSDTASVEINDDTEDPVSTITSAINDAEEDVTIYLTADADDVETEVVYSFDEALVVPDGISVSIIGNDDVTYVLQMSENVDSSSFLTVSASSDNVGSLTLENVTLDANQQGRAVIVNAYGTLVMNSGSVIENGYVEESYGAGICGNANSSVYLNEGSYVLGNTASGSDRNMYAAGVYSAGQLYMDGCYIEDNTVNCSNSTSSKLRIYGAGVYCTEDQSDHTWTNITVSGNTINQSASGSGTMYCYGAGIDLGTSVGKMVIVGGTIEDNTINLTTSTCYAYGAGIYVSSTGSTDTRISSLEDVSITGNQIVLGENASGATVYGAGILSSVTDISGYMQIVDNYIVDSSSEVTSSNCYSDASSGRYALRLVGALEDDSSISFMSKQASADSAYAAITGYYDYTMTASDYAKFICDDAENYDLVFADGVLSMVGKTVRGTGGDFEVDTEEELRAYIADASNQSDDPTNIILTADITLDDGSLSVSSGSYVTITSKEGAEDAPYSITAGAVIDGTSYSTASMLVLGGNVTITNVTLDADQKGRVIETVSQSNITIGEGTTVTGGYALAGGSGSGVYGVGISNAQGATLTLAGGSVKENTVNDETVTYPDDIKTNSTQVYGIGIYNKGTFRMTAGEITGNQDLILMESTGTYTGTDGGGIYNVGTVVISGGSITDNAVGNSGGGIFTGYTNSSVTISGDVTISGNKALTLGTNGNTYLSGDGGAIYATGSAISLTGDQVVIENNEAIYGGGIYISSSTDSSSSTSLVEGTLDIAGAQIVNNIAHISSYVAGSGGGIYMNNGVTVNMSSGTISGNKVSLDDGVDIDSAQSSLVTSLKTDGYGGGIFVSGAGSSSQMVTTANGTPVLNLTGGTISGNSAYAGGSGIFVANYTGRGASGTINSGYKFYGSGILNVSGSPVVSGNEEDDILLAASRYIDDESDPQVRTDLDDNQHDDVHVYSEYRTNIIYPVYLHVVGELTDEADLHVSKELLTYDAETLWASPRTYDYQFDGIIVEGSEDYEITEENLNDILNVVDIDILTDGFWQLSPTTVDTDDDSDDSSEADSSDTGSTADTTSALTAIEGISLDVTTAVADGEALTYSGSALTPAIVVTAAAEDETSAVLTAGTDYVVEYADNTDAGTATYTITGTGRYRGTVTGEFTIEGKSLADEDVTVTLDSDLCLIDRDSEEDQPQTPAVTVTANGTALTEGVDYTVTYEDNDAVGTATVTVTGMGSYEDSASATFRIRYSGNSVAEETDENGDTILCYETDGVVNTDYSGLVTEDDAIYYVTDGVVDTDYTGLAESDGTTYYVADGVVASDYTGLVTDGENTYYVADGIVDADAETAEIDGLLYDVTDGQASLYTGLYDGLYYEDGVPYTGIATIDGITYTVEVGVMTLRADTLAARRNGNIYYFSSSITDPDAAVTRATYGRADDEVLVGDWDNDGVDTLVARRNGNIFYFTNSITDPDAEVIRVTYGRESDEVLVGDWDGDGIDTLVIRRGNKFYFSNSNENPDEGVFMVTYGKEDDEILVGDWNGDGYDTLAVRRNGNVYYFSNSIEDTNAEVTRITYGKTTDEILVGDWNGDGQDTLAARRNGTIYYFSDSIEDVNAAVTRVTYGRVADLIYAGTWK